ncbi:cobalt-precorrin-6A reductase [Acuticoccus sp. M5D2P5]|uniref:cobalt-precorrin-6A reductase n=1 Tax=Acuticoccus kalidii TaxID=2910977 RepID=UPI001F2A912B|nr:cobalt-precorrin-6A reductase [Acuticoccus kalidii]MCF3935939.1 cobalt-precorrin-6A reductase [Acuticoccus kalidii]
MSRILLLGGTEEARELAERLVEKRADVTSSFQSEFAEDYAGHVRRGGFGGEEGLTDFIRDGGFTIVVDATHPFAATISPAAKRAAKAAGARYYRLERRPWRRATGDRWIDVRSLEEAAERIDDGARVFLTVGSRGLAPFLARRDLELFARVIERPDLGTRHDVTLITERGPFDLEHERALFQRYRFDAMVTKNSGGEATAAKLVAARERKMLVYMVKRPRGQPWANAATVDQMMRKLRRHL